MTISEGSEKLAIALLKPINPAAVVILGVYTVVWGIWLAVPFWSVFDTAPLYSALAQLAPELFWGSLAICCGLVTTYGAVKRRHRALIAGSIVAGWHWAIIGIFYFIGDWMNTGGITAITFAVYALFIWLNLRVNSKKVVHDEDLFTS